MMPGTERWPWLEEFSDSVLVRTVYDPGNRVEEEFSASVLVRLIYTILDNDGNDLKEYLFMLIENVNLVK